MISLLLAGNPHHNNVSAPRRALTSSTPSTPPRRRRSKSRPFFLAFCALLLISTIAAASPPLASIKLGDSSPPVEIVRCHFDEGRIVVRYADNLHVLRAGDELDDTSLSLMNITPESATLVIRQTLPTASLRVIKITEQDSGALLVREFATDPAALETGSPAAAPQAATRSSATDKPISTPDGD